MKPPVDSVHVPAVQKKKQKKRAKRLLWSPKSHYRPSSVVRRAVFHLPTRARTTLTYAEAQRFVDVYLNGTVTRLNVAEPLTVIKDCDVKKYHDNSNNSKCDSSPGTQSPPVENTMSSPQVVMFNSPTVINSQQGCKSSAAVVLPAEWASYYRHVDKTPDELNEEVEYDTDEQVFVLLYFCHCQGALLNIAWMFIVQMGHTVGLISLSMGLSDFAVRMLTLKAKMY